MYANACKGNFTPDARVESDDPLAHVRYPQSAGPLGTPGAGVGRRPVRQQVVGASVFILES